LPSVPYPPTQDGYWNPVTATINWCEEDYYASIYSAEIVNTLTNLVFICLAYKGIRNCIQHGHDPEFLAAFFSYLFIGIGSFFFHSSLKYSMQLLDELSMIYLTCTTFFAVFAFNKSTFIRLCIFVFTVSLAAFITGYYHYLKDPVFHQNMFALLAILVVSRGIYDMEQLRPSRRRRRSADALKESTANVDEKEQARRDARDLRMLNTMWWMVICGFLSVIIGFFIWNLDNIYCSTLRRWRREIGLPWGIVLEGHGWWHLFTGLGAYYNLTWGVYLRYCLKGMQDEVEVVWPSLFTSVPVVIRKSKAKGEVANGHKVD
ncbi:alkaline ceramidase, partial [Rhizodiscina lignyota]